MTSSKEVGCLQPIEEKWFDVIIGGRAKQCRCCSADSTFADAGALVGGGMVLFCTGNVWKAAGYAALIWLTANYCEGYIREEIVQYDVITGPNSPTCGQVCYARNMIPAI